MTDYVWIALGLVAALGGAGVAILGKIGLGEVDPTLATALRSLVMTVVLALGVLATGQWRTLSHASGQVSPRAWTFIILAGLAGAISWLAYFAALRLGTAAQVAAIDRLSLAFVILFAALFLKEQYGVRAWLGVALTILGIALIASDRPNPVTPPSYSATPSTETG